MATDTTKVEPVHLRPGFYGTVGYEPGKIPGRDLPMLFPDDANVLLAPQPATGTDLKNLRGPQSHYIWRGYGPGRLTDFDQNMISRDRGYAIRHDPDAISWCGEPSSPKREQR
jgi:hypothetical protein